MAFSLGRPMLMLALLAGAGGVAVLTRPVTAARDLTVWVYSDDEARTFRDAPPGGDSLVEQFRRRSGKSVGVELIAQRALDARLISSFLARGAKGSSGPDLVEIDLASIGKYFRPPVNEVGLLPLNDFLALSEFKDKIVPARLAPWSRHGLIFGIPRDVHPVTLTYRKDLFDEAGVDLSSAATWAEFAEMGLQYQKYWAAHGYPRRRAMELYTTQSEELLLMLLQRRINIVDDQNQVHLADPLVAQTLAFYAMLAAGERAISADTIPSTNFAYRDLADGAIGAMITPDWRVGYLKQYAPELAGKLRMMALPVFDESDAPTSTWGGTMMGIPRSAKNPAQSWKLLEYLCLSPEGLAARHRYSDIIPPVRERWGDAMYQDGDAFFGGQRVDQLYISLAGRMPPRYMTPFSITAQTALSVMLNRAVAYAGEHGDEGLLEACQGWLTDAANELKQWVHYGDFEQ
jgi:arabinosaccharide transport system substrate-binding protein